MISRRFLLSAAPAALVAASVPVKALGLAEIVTMPSTWGAGTSQLDLAMLPSVQAWVRLQNGLMTIDEVRQLEGLPAPSFDFEGLLR